MPSGTVSVSVPTAAIGEEFSITVSDYTNDGLTISFYVVDMGIAGDFSGGPDLTLSPGETVFTGINSGVAGLVVITVSVTDNTATEYLIGSTSITITEGGGGGGGGGGDGLGCRWTLYDPVTLETYTFNPNPQTTSTPHLERSFVYTNTTSQNGRPIIQEGALKPPVMEFSGKIPNQPMLDALYDWSQRKYIVLLTDDLAVARYVYIQSFKPERVRGLFHDSGWTHTYTMQCQVINVGTV